MQKFSGLFPLGGWRVFYGFSPLDQIPLYKGHVLYCALSHFLGRSLKSCGSFFPFADPEKKHCLLPFLEATALLVMGPPPGRATAHSVIFASSFSQAFFSTLTLFLVSLSLAMYFIPPPPHNHDNPLFLKD